MGGPRTMRHEEKGNGIWKRSQLRVEIFPDWTRQLVLVALLHQVVYGDDFPAHSGKAAMKHFFAIVENPLELSLHERVCDSAECAEGERVNHDVYYCSSAAMLGEAVGVHPFRVRTAQLRVFE